MSRPRPSRPRRRWLAARAAAAWSSRSGATFVPARATSEARAWSGRGSQARARRVERSERGARCERGGDGGAMGVRTALEGSPPDPRRAWGRREPPYHPPRGPWHHCSSFERLRAAPRANRAESALRKNFPGCASGRSRRVPRSARAPEGIFGSDHKDLQEFGQRRSYLPVRAGRLHSFLV